jgi:hypothetical protein
VLSVTPECYEIIQRAMRPIPVAQRQRFLSRLKESLRGCEIGVGLVARLAGELQKTFLKAPIVDVEPTPEPSAQPARSPFRPRP